MKKVNKSIQNLRISITTEKISQKRNKIKLHAKTLIYISK